MVYGRASSGRGLLTLMFIQTGVALKETSLFISPDRPKDLMIQAASIGFNLRQAHESGSVKLLRIPPLLNIQQMGDEGVAKALRDLVNIIRQERPHRLVINDFMPFVQFSRFERFRTEFIQMLEQIDSLDTTMLLIMPEPANQQSRRVIEFMSSQMTGSIHIEMIDDDAASTKRRISLIPHIGHITKQVVDYWDLEDVVEVQQDANSALRMLPQGSVRSTPTSSNLSRLMPQSSGPSRAGQPFQLRQQPRPNTAPPRALPLSRSSTPTRDVRPERAAPRPEPEVPPGYEMVAQSRPPVDDLRRTEAQADTSRYTTSGEDLPPILLPPSQERRYDRETPTKGPAYMQADDSGDVHLPGLLLNLPDDDSVVMPEGLTPHREAQERPAPAPRQEAPRREARREAPPSMLPELSMPPSMPSQAPMQERPAAARPSQPALAPASDRARFRDKLQRHFLERDVNQTPFSLVAMRLDPEKQHLLQGFSFARIAQMAQQALRPQDDLLHHAAQGRLIVLLAGSRAEEAQQFFARLTDELRKEVPQQAEQVLHAVSAIVVPDGRPFQNAEEFLTYVLDE